MTKNASLQPRPILQSALPVLPWTHPATARLPGVQPLDPERWIVIDDAYAAQMALRTRLIAERPGEVMAEVPGSEDAVAELVSTVLEDVAARPGFRRCRDMMYCPDGRGVALGAPPLAFLGQLVQEDLCLLDRRGDEHVLIAAVLCFPASWSLDEKIGRPLSVIHRPVAPYDGDMAARVQRLFGAVRVGSPLWRANALGYDDPALHQTRRESDPRGPISSRPKFIRSEVQTIHRLPRSGAVVFGIHTYVVGRGQVDPAALAAFDGKDAPR